jgi:hypothetical protein
LAAAETRTATATSGWTSTAETADERAAAELGDRYALAVDRGDLKTACDLAINEAAERLRCGAS